MSELAEHSGVTKAYLVRLEHDRSDPRLTMIEKLARALSVAPAWLAFGVNPGKDMPLPFEEAE